MLKFSHPLAAMVSAPSSLISNSLHIDLVCVNSDIQPSPAYTLN